MKKQYGIFKRLGTMVALGWMLQSPVMAESLTEKYRRFLTLPPNYVCYRTAGPITVDGRADEESWKNVPFTEAFVDISGEGFPKPRFLTRAKMLWDDDYLYVYGEMEEPDIWADILKRDEVVFYNHDFEVFIDPTGDAQNYFEIETNAVGNVFDLSIEHPYRVPTKRTFVKFQWDCTGMKVATYLDGTLNKADDRDRGWSVELAIPRKTLAAEFDNVLQQGKCLRVGFSRVEWQLDVDGNGKYSRKKDNNGNYLPEDNWTWGPTGQVAMHMPERWGFVLLSGKKAGEGTEQFAYPDDYDARRLLWATYYAQEEYYHKNRRFAASLKQLGVTAKDQALLPPGCTLRMEAISHKFETIVTKSDGTQLVVDETGRFSSRGEASRGEIPVYVWKGWGKNTTAESLVNDFRAWKKHGVKGVCFNAGMDVEKIRTAAAVAKKMGLEYHAWVPTMVQGGKDSTWYTVNRFGESAYDKPVYVPFYKTLDPRNPQVREFLVEKFREIADIPGVDFVQLDYIRYADVILAKGLWEKYGLVMNGEYAKADYCYCKDCVADFKQQTGIDITEVTDPSQVKEWAQFRCDAVTDLVNAIAEAVHAKGKKISADVFPGPTSYAAWMVRQQWDKWNLDAVFPMNYNDFYLEPASWVGKVTAESVQALKGKKTALYSGLFICHDWKNKASIEDPEGSGLLPSEMAEAVEGSIKAGANGVCLFTPDSMTPEHWEALDRVLEKLK